MDRKKEERKVSLQYLFRPWGPWRWTGPGGKWLSDPPSWCRWRLYTVSHRQWQRSPSAAYYHPGPLKLSANCPKTVSADTTGQKSACECWSQSHLCSVCVFFPPTLLALLSSTVSLEIVCVISGQRMRRMICSGHTAAFRLALSAKLSTRSNNFSAASEHISTHTHTHTCR